MTRLFRFAAAPLLLVVAALLVAGAHQRAASSGGNGRPFALRNGDRVVFYGDSITDQRLYTTFVETFAVTRFPQMERVRFVHCGWGGDRVTGGGGGPIDKRLDRDVIAHKPTVVTVMLGMNDAGYGPFDSARFAAYQRGYAHLVNRLQTALPDTRLTLVQPSPYDDATRAPNFDGGYNAVLARYGDWVRDFAREKRAQTVDLNIPVVADLVQASTLDASTAARLLPDRVHPSPGGHLLLAKALLKGWNAPALVSAVSLDARTERVSRADNTQVTELRGGGANGALFWTQTDAALPFPLDTRDPTIALAVRASDVTQALNQQPLVVTGLVPGRRYRLRIDRNEVGIFSTEQFGRGVNLAVLPTPMAAQAASVHALTLAHNNVHFARWRQVQVPNEGRLTTVQKALEKLDAAEEDLVREQRALARPRPRRFELTPLPPVN